MKNKFLIFRIKRKILSKFVKNKIVKETLKKEMTYQMLYKKFKSIIDNSNYINNKQVKNKTVWVCWFQGIENAPDIVKLCFDTLVKKFKGYKVVLLTSDNFKDYVDIPNYIIDKWQKGIISYTHFSDILRIEVLSSNGGIWVDSTVLTTFNNIPNYLETNSLFMFKEVCLDRSDYTLTAASSWFIKSDSNNSILLLTRDLLRTYWKKYNVLVDYFIFHMFFTMSTQKYKSEWDKVPIYNNINPHIMQFELKNKYSKDRFEYYKSISDFHKLSYKLDFNKLKKDCNYYHIMEEFKNEK